MTRLRHSHNTRDANEQDVLDIALKLGAVWREGPPLDGWVWVPRLAKWMPVEIKLPEREGTAREYTSAQKKFFSWCRQYNAPWWVWRTDLDVERDLGARR